MTNYEAEFRPQADDTGVRVVAAANLGPGNLGNIGPKSGREAAFAAELGNPEYTAPPADDSECMDDRNEGRKVQLAGNRALSEAIADYLDPEVPAEPLHRSLARKNAELKAMGRVPHYHEGCAAIGVSADGSVVRFIGQQMDALKPAALDILGHMVDTEVYADQAFEDARAAATERGGQNQLFSASPEELLASAKEAELPISRFSTGHNSVGHRIDISLNSYDNAAFMRAHQDEGGQPIGALSVTLGLYKKQLEDDGFDPATVSQRLLRVTLYNIAVLKMAEAEDAPGVIVA